MTHSTCTACPSPFVCSSDGPRCGFTPGLHSTKIPAPPRPPKSAYLCDRPEGCVCGGDTPGVRAGCGYFRALPPPAPIPMVLHCPGCAQQHIDAPGPGWDNRPHKSHLCHHCGFIWRVADVNTTGVAALRTVGKDDTTGNRRYEWILGRGHAVAIWWNYHPFRSAAGFRRSFIERPYE